MNKTITIAIIMMFLISVVVQAQTTQEQRQKKINELTAEQTKNTATIKDLTKEKNELPFSKSWFGLGTKPRTLNKQIEDLQKLNDDLEYQKQRLIIRTEYEILTGPQTNAKTKVQDINKQIIENSNKFDELIKKREAVSLIDDIRSSGQASSEIIAQMKAITAENAELARKKQDILLQQPASTNAVDHTIIEQKQLYGEQKDKPIGTTYTQKDGTKLTILNDGSIILKHPDAKIETYSDETAFTQAKGYAPPQLTSTSEYFTQRQRADGATITTFIDGSIIVKYPNNPKIETYHDESEYLKAQETRATTTPTPVPAQPTITPEIADKLGYTAPLITPEFTQYQHEDGTKLTILNDGSIILKHPDAKIETYSDKNDFLKAQGYTPPAQPQQQTPEQTQQQIRLEYYNNQIWHYTNIQTTNTEKINELTERKKGLSSWAKFWGGESTLDQQIQELTKDNERLDTEKQTITQNKIKLEAQIQTQKEQTTPLSSTLLAESQGATPARETTQGYDIKTINGQNYYVDKDTGSAYTDLKKPEKTFAGFYDPTTGKLNEEQTVFQKTTQTYQTTEQLQKSWQERGVRMSGGDVEPAKPASAPNTQDKKIEDIQREQKNIEYQLGTINNRIEDLKTKKATLKPNDPPQAKIDQQIKEAEKEYTELETKANTLKNQLNQANTEKTEQKNIEYQLGTINNRIEDLKTKKATLKPNDPAQAKIDQQIKEAEKEYTELETKANTLKNQPATPATPAPAQATSEETKTITLQKQIDKLESEIFDIRKPASTGERPLLTDEVAEVAKKIAEIEKIKTEMENIKKEPPSPPQSPPTPATPPTAQPTPPTAAQLATRASILAESYGFTELATPESAKGLDEKGGLAQYKKGNEYITIYADGTIRVSTNDGKSTDYSSRNQFIAANAGFTEETTPDSAKPSGVSQYKKGDEYLTIHQDGTLTIANTKTNERTEFSSLKDFTAKKGIVTTSTTTKTPSEKVTPPPKETYKDTITRLNTERTNAEAELSKRQEYFDYANEKVNAAQKKLDEAKTDTDKKNAETELNDAKAKLKERKDELDKATEELAKKEAEITRTKLWSFEEGIPVVKQAIAVSQALLKSYETFSGIGRLGSMFLTGDNWMSWRNEVSQALCDTIILGGKACWVSKVCDNYIDTTPSGNSLIARTPAGQPTGVVHLEAEKSLPIDFVNETTGKTTTGYIYKISYSITNPLNKGMTYNIQFTTQDGETYKAFDPDKNIVEGGTDGKLGSAAIYQQSKKDYTNACLTFHPGITTWDDKSVSQFCTAVSQYQGAATNPYGNQTTAPGTCNDNTKNQGETGIDCGGPCDPCGTEQKPKSFEGF